MLDWEALVPYVDQSAYWEMIFSFTYQPHGGSGIPGLTEAALMEYDMERLEWLAERLDAQRSREAEAARRK